MTKEAILMKDLAHRLGKLGSDEMILDVRSPEEFKAGHVPGSRNIPHDQVASHVSELGKFKKIFLHCQMGGRAKMAAAVLEGAGLQNIVCISDAGMKAWMDAGLPVEK